MRRTDTIRHWIAKVVPGYQAVEQIAQTKQEFSIDGGSCTRLSFLRDGLKR